MLCKTFKKEKIMSVNEKNAFDYSNHLVSFEVLCVTHANAKKVSMGGSKWMTKYIFTDFPVENAKIILSSECLSKENYEKYISQIDKTTDETPEKTCERAIFLMAATINEYAPRIFNLKVKENEDSKALPQIGYEAVGFNSNVVALYNTGMELKIALKELEKED